MTRIFWLAQRSTAERERIRDNYQSTQSMAIPGLRGRIIGQDGVVLAASERRLRLFWRVPAEASTAEAVLARWQALPNRPFPLPALPELSENLGQTWRIAENLDMQQAELWHMAQEPENGLELRAHFVRNYPQGECWHELLGSVQSDPDSGLECGISGLEKDYDDELRGHVVTLKLLSGNRRALIKETRTWQENQGNGRDIHLDIRICAQK